MSLETFEQVLTAAQAAGSFTPAWKKFVNTRFFVPTERSAGNDPQDYTLYSRSSDGQPAVTISELRQRIEAGSGNAVVLLSGAELVRRLQADCAIVIALSDRVFLVAKDRVDWLRKGIEAAQARKAEAAKPAPAAFPQLDMATAIAPRTTSETASETAPQTASATPAPVRPASAATVSLAKAPDPVAPALVPMPSASTPVTRNQVGVLDVAALRPRNVTIAKIGLDFFVPSAWTESASATGLRFTDAERQTTVEVSGFHRPGLSMAQWLAMRTSLVQHEMRYLTQDGDAYAFEGESWRARVKGMATEFTGTFPGDTVESRYLVACIWTDGVLASITVRAPAAVFEQNRALYKWLLSRVDMHEAAAAVYSAPSSLAAGASAGDWDEGETPPMFAFSLAGRMGRARVLAYTFPMMLVAALVGIVAAVLLPLSKVFGGIAVIAGVGMLAWFCLRLMVLRMHDINLSGKWLLGILVVFMLAGATQNLVLLGVASLVFWIGSLVIYCFIPGTNGDNDYGEAPGPNSTLVNVGAALFIALQLIQLGTLGSGKYNNQFKFPASRLGGSGASVQNDKLFTAPDNSFSVMLPGVPQEITLPPAALKELGEIELHQYQLLAQGNAYMVQSINYYDSMPDNRFDAMDSMQQSVLGKDGTLLDASPILLKGASGRQVKVSLPGGGIRAARFAIVGTRFCMVTISAPAGAKASPQIDAFLHSFKLN